MAAVSEGETGVAALTAQIALQQLILISSENSKGSQLHPMSLPPSVPAPLFCSTSHFPWWEQPGPSPSSSPLGRCSSVLHRPLTRLQWIACVSLQKLSPAGCSCPAEGTRGCRSFPALSLPRHNGDPLKKPPLHLCLCASVLCEKIDIAVCC